MTEPSVPASATDPEQRRLTLTGVACPAVTLKVELMPAHVTFADVVAVMLTEYPVPAARLAMNDADRVPDVFSVPMAATELEAVRIFHSTALIDVPSGIISASWTAPKLGSLAARSLLQPKASSAPANTMVPTRVEREARCPFFMRAP